MTQYHVGCGITAIWAGTLNAKGDKWRNKSDSTIECLSASAQYLMQQGVQFGFKYHGKKYNLTVIEAEGETDA